jgi:uncharacterized lipoprotein YddW (UPF0748 family)
MKKITIIILTAAFAMAFAAAPLSALPGRDSGLKMAVRGVWAHPGTFGPDQAKAVPLMRKTLDEYVRAGIDTVIMLVKNTNGYVYFRSETGVGDPAYTWDFLGAFLKEAKARNISVHPWFCVFHETGILGEFRKNPEWLITGRHREMVGAANPALPEVREYELSLMMEVAKNYPVDWIHLDYIRFPCEPTEPYFSFDPKTRALFKEFSGWDPLEIKAQDSGNMIWNEWLEWNRDRVTQFVAELKDALKTMGRSIKISAAVFLDPDNARVLIGQDWAKWAERGLVDMLCPMLYTDHDVFFEKYVKRAVAVAKGRCQVCAGIGILSSHNKNTPEGMIRQMKITKDCGADGVIYFSSGSLTAPFLKKLRAAD